MAKKFFLALVICLILSPLISAELQVGLSSDGGEGIGINFQEIVIPFNNDTGSVNFSEFSNLANFAFNWVTDQGNMNNVPDLYPTLDGRYLQLTGGTMTGPIDMGGFNIFNSNQINATEGNFDNIYNRMEVDELVQASSIELFFKNSISGISTYWDMNRSSNGAAKNATAITLSADSTEIGGFVSPNASDLGIDGLDEGIITGHFHASVDNTLGKKAVDGYFQIYLRNSTGEELLLSTSHLVRIDVTDETNFEAHANLLNEIVLNESDRIVMKLFANLSGAGGNPTLTTYIQGDTLSRGIFGVIGVNFATQRDLLLYYKLDGTNNLTANVDGQGFDLTGWDNGIFNSLTVATLDNGGSPIVFNDEILMGVNKDINLNGEFLILGGGPGTAISGGEEEDLGRINFHFSHNGAKTVRLGASFSDTPALYPGEDNQIDLGSLDAGIFGTPKRWKNLGIAGDANIGGTINLGTNTISEGQMVGDWDMNTGSITNATNITATGLGTFGEVDVTGLGTFGSVVVDTLTLNANSLTASLDLNLISQGGNLELTSSSGNIIANDEIDALTNNITTTGVLTGGDGSQIINSGGGVGFTVERTDNGGRIQTFCGGGACQINFDTRVAGGLVYNAWDFSGTQFPVMTLNNDQSVDFGGTINLGTDTITDGNWTTAGNLTADYVNANVVSTPIITSPIKIQINTPLVNATNNLTVGENLHVTNQSFLGTFSGAAGSKADQNIMLYDVDATNWAGIQADSSGSIAFNIGTGVRLTPLRLRPSTGAVEVNFDLDVAGQSFLGTFGGTVGDKSGQNIILYDLGATNWAGIQVPNSGDIVFSLGLGTIRTPLQIRTASADVLIKADYGNKLDVVTNLPDFPEILKVSSTDTSGTSGAVRMIFEHENAKLVFNAYSRGAPSNLQNSVGLFTEGDTNKFILGHQGMSEGNDIILFTNNQFATPQWTLLQNGSGIMTGDLDIGGDLDMGTNNIINVGLINGGTLSGNNSGDQVAGDFVHDDLASVHQDVTTTSEPTFGKTMLGQLTTVTRSIVIDGGAGISMIRATGGAQNFYFAEDKPFSWVQTLRSSILANTPNTGAVPIFTIQTNTDIDFLSHNLSGIKDLTADTINANNGFTGSFEINNGDDVTVVNGIITDVS